MFHVASRQEKGRREEAERGRWTNPDDGKQPKYSECGEVCVLVRKPIARMFRVTFYEPFCVPTR